MNPRFPQVLQPLDETAETPVSDNSIHQGMQRLYASQQQCVDRVSQIDNRLEQFRQAIRQDALEIALTVQRVTQDLQGQGQTVEQIRHTLFNLVREKVETLDERFQTYDEFAQTVLDKTDRNTHEAFSTISKIIDDVRRIVEELARQVDDIRSEGAMEAATQEGSGVAMQLEVNDVKTKVLRLTEQITEHNAKVNFF